MNCPECGGDDLHGLNPAPMIASGYSHAKCESCGHYAPVKAFESA